MRRQLTPDEDRFIDQIGIHVSISLATWIEEHLMEEDATLDSTKNEIRGAMRVAEGLRP